MRSGSEADAHGGEVAIFAPNPLLIVTVESRGEGMDDVHVHPGGQGVWVARMAAELGAEPMLCSFLGGEAGKVLEPLLEALPGERHLVRTAGPSGAIVFDRRSGDRVAVADSHAEAPSRHELDDLFSVTTSAALAADVAVICNPYPGETLPLEIYGNLAADIGANGTPVLADLSSPRLDSVLEGKPQMVKLNDWELAAYVSGPVDTAALLLTAAEQMLEAGARSAIVTRAGEPALVVRDDEEPLWIVPPRFERGAREGCGDSMMGAIAACLAAGQSWEDALVTGAAAGAVNFLRHGLGTGDHATIAEVAEQVELRPF